MIVMKVIGFPFRLMMVGLFVAFILVPMVVIDPRILKRAVTEKDDEGDTLLRLAWSRICNGWEIQ